MATPYVSNQVEMINDLATRSATLPHMTDTSKTTYANILLANKDYIQNVNEGTNDWFWKIDAELRFAYTPDN